jgi:hypothetical protein
MQKKIKTTLFLRWLCPSLPLVFFFKKNQMPPLSDGNFSHKISDDFFRRKSYIFRRNFATVLGRRKSFVAKLAHSCIVIPNFLNMRKLVNFCLYMSPEVV